MQTHTIQPNYNDIEQAHRRIATYIHHTPVITSDTLNRHLDAEVFFKSEHLQKMGAFKFRGAMNALLQFTPEQRQQGVIAYSSGNHAQAIALSARKLGIPATIIMPADAPAAKMAATRDYGATIITYDRYCEDREAISQAFVQEHGYTLIPPYDHPHIIAGQGTAAKELFETSGPLDYLFVPLGGGGLLAGSLLSAKKLAPHCQVFGVEPQAGNDGQRSLRAGNIIHIDTPKTIADGAQTQHLGQLTFPIIQSLVSDIITANDEELITAMRFFIQRMKTVVEPTGCLGLAGLTQMTETIKGKRVGVILSGGNVDLDLLAKFIC